jgi:hypothetical protein
MKKTLLAVLLVMVVFSWCLAQTDSLPAPTAGSLEDTIKAAPVVVKTAKGPDKKWIIGFEAASLDFKDLPGTVFLQRKVSSKLFAGAGFNIYYSVDDPNEDHNDQDSSRYNYQNKQWSIVLSPEIGYTALNTRQLTGGISVRTTLRRFHTYTFREQRYERYNYSYSTSVEEYNLFDYGIYLPVFLEKQFKIKKYQAAVGITSNLISLTGGWYKYRSKDTNESLALPIPDIYENESTTIQPVVFRLDNPFQGYVRVFFKIYL